MEHSIHLYSYDSNATAGATLTINPAAPTITLTAGTFTYNASAENASAAVTGLSGTIAGTTSFTYNGSSTAPTSAGTYAVVATFTSGDSDYASGAAGATLTINKATPTESVTGGSYTYNGSAESATAAATGLSGTVAGTTSFTYNGSSTAPTDAGTYTVIGTFTSGDGNYNNATGSATLTIGKANVSLSVTGGSYTYDGSAEAATETATGLSGTVAGGMSFTYNGSATAPTDAGSYAVVGTFTSSDGDYNNATAGATLTIGQATPTVSVTGGTYDYDAASESATATATGLSGTVAGTMAFTYDGSGTAPTDAGTYAVIGTFTRSDGDYSGATAGATLTIDAATPSFSALSSPTITFGASSVTLSGQITPTLVPSGGTVTITLNGATQTASVDSSGDFSSSFDTSSLASDTYDIAYAFAGNSNVNATSADGSLLVRAEGADLYADPTQTLEAQTGQSISGIVADFASAYPDDATDPDTAAGNYSAVIDWGDGDTSAATVTADDSVDGYGSPIFDIAPAAAYTYTTAGTYSGANVVVTNTDTAEELTIPLPAAAYTVAIVSNPALEVDLGASVTGTLATFSTTESTATADEFTASIDWGNGDVSSATITAGTSSGQFTIAPGSDYAFPAVGSNAATITLTDDLTGGIVTIPLSVTSDGVYGVRVVNTTVLAEQLSSNTVGYNSAAGTPDANGWVYVDADNEQDAIAKAIFADVTSNNGSEYRYGEGYADSAFSLSADTASDAPLGWRLNLDNWVGSTDYQGSAELQVRPVIEDFSVSNVNNADNVVSPTDPTVTYLNVVSDPTTGDAAIDLSATMSVDDSAHRTETYWTLAVDHNSEVVDSGTLSSDGSDTIIDLPSGYSEFVLEFGYDMNGDGSLNNAEETQRVVYVEMGTHAAFDASADTIYATAGQSVSGEVANFEGDSGAVASDYSATITWGDGATSAGTIVANDDGTFSVDGSHTYGSVGTNATSVSIWPTAVGSSAATSDSGVAYVRDSSLAADWEFADGPSDDAGTYFDDVSGQAGAAVLVNGPVWASGPDNVPGLEFDGTGQWATIDDSSGLDPTTAITVTADINAYDWDNASATILQKGTGQYGISVEGGELVFGVDTTAGFQTVDAPLPSTDTWHTITGSYDGSTLTLGIDGSTYSASTSGTIITSDGALIIGDKSASTSQDDAFSGMISSVSVYGHAIASADLIVLDRHAGVTLTPASRLSATFIGASSSTINAGGYLTGGALATSVDLKWRGGTACYYWVFYTTNPASGVYQPLGFVKKKADGRFDDSILLSTLGESTTSARSGQPGVATYYFTVVPAATRRPVPPPGRRTVFGSTAAGGFSLRFCAPQIYFISGDTDGDGQAGSSAPDQTAFAQAAFDEAAYGAQVTTFAWANFVDGTSNGTADLDGIVAALPTSIPIVLMGQSFGGGAAVAVANWIVNQGYTTRHISYLDLFDPVAAHSVDDYEGVYVGNFNPVTSPTVSWFDVPATANYQVTDWYSPYSTIDPYATGAVVAGTTHFRRLVTDVEIPGLTHISEVYQPSVMSAVALQLQTLSSDNEWEF